MQIKWFKNITVVGCILNALALSACDKNHEHRKIGHVNTHFKLIGHSDRIEISTFADPDVSGITCFISNAKTGGAKELVNMEEDVSDASLSCVKTKEVITFNPKVVEKPRIVYKRDANLTFKSQQVKSYYDEPSNSFIYMVYSDKILDGSPKNSIAAISCHDGYIQNHDSLITDKTLDKNGKPNQQIVGNCFLNNHFTTK